MHQVGNSLPLRYPAVMAQRSPTLEGLRAVIRQPALLLAEVSWRWTFGGAALFLLAFAGFEYLNSLLVTAGEQLFLRSRQPFLISQAIAQIFSGSAPRLVRAALVVFPALSLFWIAAASLGRLATLRSLFDYFSMARAESVGRMTALLGLNFLRVSLVFACAIGFAGAAILAGFVSSPSDPSPALAFTIFLALAAFVLAIWSTLNWYLSVAPLFALGEGQDTFGALAAAVQFARFHAGPVFWSSTIFGLLHLLAFIVASLAALLPMLVAGVLPRAVVALGITLVTLVYFAAADLLYLGKLAAYVAILRPESQDIRSVPAPLTPEDAQAAATAGPVDRIPPSDDDILSDIPGLVPPPEPAH